VLLLASSVAALADNEKGLYAGAGVGQFNVKIDDVDDAVNTVSEFDSDDTSFRIFGGWRFSPYIAVDLAYIDFGGPDEDVNGQNVKADIDGFAPAVYGTLPLGPIELFAKVGYLFYDLNVEIGGEEIADVSGSDEDLIYGGGIGITLFERLNARLEYEIIDVSEVDDSNAIWLTGAWRF
jgi:OOP family OmpA-OmpF porin